eukprot:6180412-Pleurochrysis_carterae.AAC.4
MQLDEVVTVTVVAAAARERVAVTITTSMKMTATILSDRRRSGYSTVIVERINRKRRLAWWAVAARATLEITLRATKSCATYT